MRHSVVWVFVVAIDLAAVVLAPILDIKLHNDAAFQISYGVAAITTFLVLMPIALDSDEPRFGFRELIASSFIVTYLMLVTAAAFFHANLPEGNITASLVSNFTTLTGVVVGFYFVASASDRAVGIISRDRTDSAAKGNESNGADGDELAVDRKISRA